MGIKIGILLLLVSGSVIEAQPTLTIQPAVPNTGSTLTLTCELAGFTNALMNFKKDGTSVYTCVSGGNTCVDSNGVSDYSEVDWSQTDKGIITISNADQTRDGGDWTCAVGSGGGTSAAVTLAITDVDCPDPTKPTNGQVTFTATTYQSTATYSCDSGYTLDGSADTTCQSDATWSGSVPTCTADTPTLSDGSLPIAGIVIGGTYGLSLIGAAGVNLFIYNKNQARLAWKLCDGPINRLWIWLLLFLFLPYIPSVIAIYLFRTKPTGKPTKPVISPKSVSVKVGDLAKFTCTSSSTTDPAESGLTMIYTWRRNRVDMKSEGRYTVSGQTLTVTNVVQGDASDIFTCLAQEVKGLTSDESDSARIVISKPPSEKELVEKNRTP